MEVCDFCDSPLVVRRYQCCDFNAESKDAGFVYAKPDGTEPVNLVLDSKSYWAACAECARYVDAEDIDGLVKHVAAAFNTQAIPQPHRKALLIHFRHTYALFFKNRIRVESVPVDSSRSSPQGETP